MNVQKLLIAGFFALLTTFTASAQVSHQLGLTFGSNYSTLHTDLFPVASGRLSYAIGASFNIGITGRFSLNQEIVYTQKGASAEVAFFRPEQAPELRSYDYHYTTFETGVFGDFQPVLNVPVHLQAGGFAGTHFHNLDREPHNVYVGDYNNVNEATAAYTLNNAFSGVDFGPAAGISAGSGQFRVNARYYLGARNMYRNLKFAEPGHTIRSSTVRLTLTYFLK